MSVQKTVPGLYDRRQPARGLAGILLAGVLLLVLLVGLMRYVLVVENNQSMDNSWTRFHRNGPFDAGAAIPVDNGEVLYSTPLIGQGDILRFGKGARTPIVVSEDATEIQPAVSTSGAMLAFVRQQGSRSTIWVCDIDGQNQRELTDPPLGHDLHPRFVAQDKRVRYLRWKASSGLAASGELREVDISTGQEYSLGTDVTDISPDGRLLCRTQFNHETRKNEVSIESINGTRTRIVGHGHLPRFSPDGKWIVFVNKWWEEGVMIADVDGQPAKTLCKLPAYPGSLDFSPDSQTLLITLDNREQSVLWAIDVRTGKLLNERSLPMYKLFK